MSDWSGIGETGRYDSEGDTALSKGTTVTSGGSANTKGSWAELVASSAFDAQGFILCNIPNNSAVWLTDIGVGASGSEQVIVPDFHTGALTSESVNVFVPIPIPAGTRISARSQSSGAGLSSFVHVILLAQGFLPSGPLARIEAWGVDATDSGATSVDGGGTINTKGAWSQLIATTGFDVKAVIVVFGHQGVSGRSGVPSYLIDIGVGAASSEQVVLPNLVAGESGFFSSVFPHVMGPFPLAIPAGSRVAARLQANTTDATARKFDVAVYGIG